MEYAEITTDSKQDVMFQLLCMGCLYGGRAIKTITEPALTEYYMDILFHHNQESPAFLAQQLTRAPRLTPCPLAPDDGLAPGDPRDEFEPLLAQVTVEIEEEVELAGGDAVGEMEGEPTSEIEDETLNRQNHMVRDPVATTSERKEKKWIDIIRVEMKRFQCVVCSKGFLYNSDLKYHMMSHTGEKPFMCMVCDKRFSQNGKLKIHMRTHTGEKLMCPVCQKGYNQTSDLKVHMRTHTGEKPYPCTTCEKAFKKSGDLKIHMRIHTGERPYTCSVCQRGFNQSGELTIHTRTHTGKKPYKCTLCEKVYRVTFN